MSPVLSRAAGPLLAALVLPLAAAVAPAGAGPPTFALQLRSRVPHRCARGDSRAPQGSVGSPQNVLTGQSTRISGANSYVVLDFGKEVGGLVTLRFAGVSGANQQVGLAFSESSQYVGEQSDASSGGGGADGAIYAAVPAPAPTRCRPTSCAAASAT